MKWQGRRQSENVDDRRGGMSRVGGGIGIGTIIMAAAVYFMGGNPLSVIQNAMNEPAEYTQSASGERKNEELAQFVKVVLAETEDVWTKIYPQITNKQYSPPTLVIFDGETTSGCGRANAATGPFYCPADQQVYIDLGFYNEMSQRFGASGDFAMAYVVAHEVAHHIQNLLGISSQVSRQRGRISEAEYNQLSVRLELQADFLAGVWANHGNKMKAFLEQGDIEEAMNAANAIGDDRLQKQSQGYVVPDAFTHGTSKQRMKWFKAGFASGDPNQGDTFSIPYDQL